uniref:Uncharacterized protein n=1 Tax=Rangifer tarandus platyrhynchus TaxID=3082113 RepID=A0ACB0EUX2_RANTA|nr:unnamed protein product [Rangifer tarandus platyrhynchus]
MPEEQCPFHRPLIAPRSQGFGEAAAPGGTRMLLREARVWGRLERSGAGRFCWLTSLETGVGRRGVGRERASQCYPCPGPGVGLRPYMDSGSGRHRGSQKIAFWD